MKLAALASVAGSVVALFATGQQQAGRGALTEVRGVGGCISPPGQDERRFREVLGCAIARGPHHMRPFDAAVAASPDGRHIYVARGLDQDSTIFALARNARSGALRQLPGVRGCIALGGHGRDRCTAGRASRQPKALVVSPDGRNVYVIGWRGGQTLGAYARDLRTGALSDIQCVGGGNDCPQAARALGHAVALAISPDGRNVYVASPENRDEGRGLAVFSREPRQGRLKQLPGASGCIKSPTAPDPGCTPSSTERFAPSAVGVSPDGRNVYVASVTNFGAGSGAVLAYARNPVTGSLSALPGAMGCLSSGVESGVCARVDQVAGVRAVVASPDGSSLYLGVQSGIALLSRDAATGALSYVGLARVRGGVSSIAVSRDGRNVYATHAQLHVFTRDSASGRLTRLPGLAGCHGDGRGCTATRADGMRGLVVSPDGRAVYVAGGGDVIVTAFTRKF